MKVKMCKETLEQEGWSLSHPGVARYGTVEYVEKDVSPWARYLLDGRSIHRLFMSVLLVHFKRELKKNKPTAEIVHTYVGPIYDEYKGGKYINEYIIIEYYMSDSEDYQDFGFHSREHIWLEIYS